MSSNSTTISSTSLSETSTPLDTSTSASVTSTSSEVTSSSSAQESTSTPPTTSIPAESTSTSTLSSEPTTTIASTQTIVITPTASGTTLEPTTVIQTVTRAPSTTPSPTDNTSSGTSTTTSDPALNTGAGSSSSSGNGGGLSTAGVTAIAVVVPVVVVAVLVLAGIFLWRKRKQKKAAEEARRKEVEDYGFNPNNDPTLPAVASDGGHEMSEDNGGYRGWGAATASRKMSTTLSGGHTQGQLSDAGSNPYRGANSPSGGASDGNSGDAMLHQRRETMSSDIGSLGQGPVAGTNMQPGVKRGPSNASSTYSAGGHSDVSDGPGPHGGMPQSYEAYNPASGFGYSQHGPYGDGTYGGAAQDGGMPIVQDVSARRNTRIQQPGNYQQGNSGIAQNF